MPNTKTTKSIRRRVAETCFLNISQEGWSIRFTGPWSIHRIVTTWTNRLSSATHASGPNSSSGYWFKNQTSLLLRHGSLTGSDNDQVFPWACTHPLESTASYSSQGPGYNHSWGWYIKIWTEDRLIMAYQQDRQNGPLPDSIGLPSNIKQGPLKATTKHLHLVWSTIMANQQALGLGFISIKCEVCQVTLRQDSEFWYISNTILD